MNDAEAKVMSNDTEDDVRLVPVSESIRYRKRAQQAEQKVEQLSQQLNQSKEQNNDLHKHLSEIELEQQLTKKLIAAGAADIETALLVAKTRSADKEDMDSVIEQMKTEKEFLFEKSGSKDNLDVSFRTAGVKDNNNNAAKALQQAAKQAASTGSHRDLQQYLKLRRNFI